MVSKINKKIKRLEWNSVSILNVYKIMDNLKNELEERKTDKYESRMLLQRIEKSSPEIVNTIIYRQGLMAAKAVHFGDV